ncbi:forkhead domain-containing protein [Rutstroemia sp. NJR-2017a WRK4]|nr:forkhead domain-containing protein [Rutstroemia sp. NJR-2017a WRK4]
MTPRLLAVFASSLILNNYIRNPLLSQLFKFSELESSYRLTAPQSNLTTPNWQRDRAGRFQMVLSMDHSQFQQNSHNQNLVWAFQTQEDRKPAETSQPPDVFQSFDGLPIFNADHFFIVASEAPQMPNNYAQMPNSYSPSTWEAPVLPPVMPGLGENAGGYSGYSYDCSSNLSTNDQHSPAGIVANVPRTPWNGPYDTTTLDDSMQMRLPIYEQHSNLAHGHGGVFTAPRIEQRGRIEDYTMLDTINQTQTSCSPPSTCSDGDEQGSHEQQMMDAGTDDQTTDGPYAKLIYRALMSAPNHSMVLQEIYRWFRENTSKGSSESKGWMNSIRHNLSMNAAFKKTERKIPGDEAKKSTEWVLQEFAIRDGVQSTTRYRKGTGAKRYIRPDPHSRNYAARHGFGAVRKPTFYPAGKERTQRLRDRDDIISPKRPMPASSEVLSANSTAQHQVTNMTAISVSLRLSPITPCQQDFASYSPVIKQESYDHAYDHYRFEDCQGVLNDSASPLFMDEQTSSQFMPPHSMCGNQQF